MNNRSEAKSMFQDAGLVAQEARESSQHGHHHRVVRKCQESVELALKALLLNAGIEYPKVHDVSKALFAGLAGKLDKQTLVEAARISSDLADKRSDAFYGTATTPAAKLFGPKDAEVAMVHCNRILEIVSEYLGKM